MNQNSGFGANFEWLKHEKCIIYQSSDMAFKIKREKLDTPVGEKELHGIEVYISDDPRTKDWRPMRLFREDGQEAINRIMKWVESIAERLTEERQVDMKHAD